VLSRVASRIKMRILHCQLKAGTAQAANRQASEVRAASTRGRVGIFLTAMTARQVAHGDGTHSPPVLGGVNGQMAGECCFPRPALPRRRSSSVCAVP
jgi:hypothetical protein